MQIIGNWSKYYNSSVWRFIACCLIYFLAESEFSVGGGASCSSCQGGHSEELRKFNFDRNRRNVDLSQLSSYAIQQDATKVNKDGEHEQQRKLVLWSFYRKALHFKTSKWQGYSRRHEQTRVWRIFRFHSEGNKTWFYTVSQNGSWFRVPERPLHYAELNTFHMRYWQHHYAQFVSWLCLIKWPAQPFSSEQGLYWP